MALALLSVPLPGERSVRAVIGKRWVLFSISCFVLGAAIYVLRVHMGGYPYQRVFLNGLMCVLVLAPTIFAVAGDRGPERFLGGPILGWLALISYGTYLYHLPIMNELEDQGLGNDGSIWEFFALIGGGTALSVICGALSYYLLEQRFLKYKHRTKGKDAPAKRQVALESR